MTKSARRTANRTRTKPIAKTRGKRPHSEGHAMPPDEEKITEAENAVEDAAGEVAQAAAATSEENDYEPHEIKSKIKALPLLEIGVRKHFNMRSRLGSVDEPEEQVGDDSFLGGFDPKTGKPSGGLIGAIYLGGQKHTLDVRPSAAGGVKEPYELITGERRYRAMMALHEHGFTWPGGGTLEAPTVRVNLYESITDAEAEDLNAIENLGREDCKSADVAFALWRMAKNGRSGNAVAKLTSRSQSYVSKLLRIMKYVPPKCTRAWRMSPTDINYKELLPLVELDPRTGLPKLTREEIEAGWEAILGRHTPSSEGGKEGKAGASADKWIETAKTRAADFARTLGMFEGYGCKRIQDVIDKLGEEGWLEMAVKVKKDAGKRARNAIVKAAVDAYVSGKSDAIAAQETPEDDAHAA